MFARFLIGPIFISAMAFLSFLEQLPLTKNAKPGKSVQMIT